MSTPDLVLGGLGGDGPIVTGGLGLTGAPDPNAMRATLRGTGALQATLSAAGDGSMVATLAGSSSLTAALTDPNVATQAAPRRLRASVPPRGKRRPVPAPMKARLTGSSSLTADLTGVDVDAATVLMLLDLDLMLTEGVTL